MPCRAQYSKTFFSLRGLVWATNQDNADTGQNLKPRTAKSIRRKEELRLKLSVRSVLVLEPQQPSSRISAFEFVNDYWSNLAVPGDGHTPICCSSALRYLIRRRWIRSRGNPGDGAHGWGGAIYARLLLRFGECARA